MRFLGNLLSETRFVVPSLRNCVVHPASTCWRTGHVLWDFNVVFAARRDMVSVLLAASSSHRHVGFLKRLSQNTPINRELTIQDELNRYETIPLYECVLWPHFSLRPQGFLWAKDMQKAPPSSLDLSSRGFVEASLNPSKPRSLSTSEEEKAGQDTAKVHPEYRPRRRKKWG